MTNKYKIAWFLFVMGHIRTMMCTFIDAPPGGATKYSFDGDRLFILSNRIGDIYN